jgi:hypothetical protein
VIGAVRGPSAREPAQPAARVVEAKTTRTAPVEIRAAIGRAWERLTGRAPTQGALDALSAQALLETGRGESMVAFNFGGIKGVGPSGLTTRARTKEVADGRTVEIVDGFRAYTSLDEGALDYVRLLRSRFGAAVSQAENGNLDGFAHELRRAHYYTADERDYARALHAVAGETGVRSPPPRTQASPSPGLEGPSRFARATELVHLLDSLRTSALRVIQENDADAD